MTMDRFDDVPLDDDDTPAPSNGHSNNLTQVRRPFRSNSQLTTYELLREDRRNILRGRVLRLNEMTGVVEFGDRQIRDTDVARIVCEIERVWVGGVDKNNNEIGMKQPESAVYAALHLLAEDNHYHPVREWLTGLKWDGVQRLDNVCDEVLNAERTEINQIMLRKWFVSAVARAMVPGSKVDTALILIGRQGRRKSTFFYEVASPWFVESSIDVNDKDSFQVLREGWVVEWPELEVMNRARDLSAVKAFLTKRSDSYRPAYGRCVINVPRGCVIVGTTNKEEFLTDDENRRFWPIRVGDLNIELLRDWRKQLWAEAVTLYRATLGQQFAWWLDEPETAKLNSVHRNHGVTDPWTEKIITWACEWAAEFRTADVLEKALCIEVGRWSHGEAVRAANVLQRNGWELDPNKPRGKSRVWRRRSLQYDLAV